MSWNFHNAYQLWVDTWFGLVSTWADTPKWSCQQGEPWSTMAEFRGCKLKSLACRWFLWTALQTFGIPRQPKKPQPISQQILKNTTHLKTAKNWGFHFHFHSLLAKPAWRQGTAKTILRSAGCDAIWPDSRYYLLNQHEQSEQSLVVL